jgi:hypothetical protein
MTVDEWVLEAVERFAHGATLRDVQRSIDEHRYEELAIDTIEAALQALVTAGRVVAVGERWRVQRSTSKEDALRRLFGDPSPATTEEP